MPASAGGSWIMLVAVLLACVSEVFADVSAQSVLPMTVAPGHLTAASGRVVSTQMIGNEFAGAPVAGLLVTLLPAAVFGAPALLYGAARLLLVAMRGRFRPRPESAGRRSMTRDIGEALRYLWRHRFLRTLAVSAGLLNFASAAYFGVLVLWIVGDGSRIGMEPTGYGLMMTAFAVGAVAGSLVSDRVTRLFGEGRALGRVNSTYRLIGMGGMPIEAVLGRVLGEFAGLPVVFFGAAAVCLAAVGLVWRVVPDQISAPLTSGATIPDISRSCSVPKGVR